MKKVLIITYHFPPRPTMGSVRMGGLAKYLPELGWKPIILTAELPGDADPQFEVIQTPYHDIVFYWKKMLGLNPNKMARQQLEIHRNNGQSKLMKRILYLGRDIIAYPDPAKGWYSFAVKFGNALLQQNEVHAIISSHQPATSHLIAKELKVRWNIPWIADFRDAWAHGYVYKRDHSALRRFFEKRLMLRTISGADALVTVSKPLVQDLRDLHIGRPVYEIPNGFDLSEVKSNPSNGLTKNFTITYTGSLHGCLRDPSGLFEAVRELISEEAMDSSRVQIRFYGEPDICLEKLVEHYGMQKLARHCGLVSRKASLEKQRESQLLLLLNWSDCPATDTYTGKLFEYLSARRPILSIGKAGGVIEELLNDTNAGIYAPKLYDIKNFLQSCYSEFESKGEVIYRGLESKISKYSHFEMARKFSEVLNTLCKKV